ncbi:MULTISPECIES: lipocalin family protein [Winogradskyella]|uniref:lipocalin family protein n=1 Tax=Winogradskyella TaxID=286104 RepID=UPI001B0585FE|nr:lipocalin family protein [Winogradskyella sp.]MBO6880332.1 hypothetical protein [Winogradskyella sp.]
MKRILLILAVVATVTSCSRDEDHNYSAIENLIGQWELQSRILNDTDPQPTDDAKFIFRDDNDIRDFKGLFTLESNDTSSGTFKITNNGNVMEFETSNGITFSYEYILNTATLVLGYANADGDVVKETWIKTSNFID